VVAEALELVVVLTGNTPTEGGDGYVALLLDGLLPAVHDVDALPADPEGEAALAARVERLRQPPPRGEPPAMPAVTDAVSGRRWRFEPNLAGFEALTLDFDRAQDDGEGTLLVEGASGAPVPVLLGLDGAPRLTDAERSPSALDFPVAGSARWLPDDRLEVALDETNDIDRWVLTWTFDGDEVTVDVDERTYHPPPLVLEGSAAVEAR